MTEKSEKSEKLKTRQVVYKKLMSPSMLVIGWVTWVGDCCRGILFPVLWPLCHKLGGTKKDLGLLVAMFSIGRLIITTTFGEMSDKFGHRFTLMVANIVLALGTLFWASSYGFGDLGVLYLAQVMLGVGSGTLGVTRSYVVEQTAPERRTYVLARLSALQYAGFTVSPIAGAALLVVGSSFGLYWKFSLPPFLIFLCALLVVVLLILVFEDLDRLHDNEEREELLPTSRKSYNEDELKASDIDASDVDDSKSVYEEPHKVQEDSLEKEKEVDISYLMYFFMMLNFATRGGIAVYETLGAQIMVDEYFVSVILVGFLVTSSGIVGTIQMAFYKEFWVSRYSDTTLILGGM